MMVFFGEFCGIASKALYSQLFFQCMIVAALYRIVINSGQLYGSVFWPMLFKNHTAWVMGQKELHWAPSIG